LDHADRFGLEALTIEGLASHLGIAKTTIYRRWPNSSSLIADAVLSDVTKMTPLHEYASARQTFGVQMKQLAAMYAGPRGRLIRSVMGRAQLDPELVKQIGERWIEPGKKMSRAILHKAVMRGEIKADSDPDVLLTCLYGSIYHRFLVPFKDSGTTEAIEDFVERVLDIVFDGVAAGIEKKSSVSCQTCLNRTF
jgi:AcrR family transcriptional regulator